MENYAKVVVKGSPISKSNFKLFNTQGRAILPYNSESIMTDMQTMKRKLPIMPGYKTQA